MAPFATTVRRVASFAPLAVVATLWAIANRDAWRVRATVDRYGATPDEVRARSGALPRPDDLRRFHDELVAAGADYFYPFGSGVFLAMGLGWLVAITAVSADLTGIRRWLVAAGAVAVVTDLVLFAEPLAIYTSVTD